MSEHRLPHSLRMIMALGLFTALAASCNNDEKSPQPRLRFFDAENGQISLQFCASAESAQLLLEGEPEAPVQLRLDAVPSGYVDFDGSELSMDARNRLSTLNIRCARNPDHSASRTISVTATTQSDDADFSGLSASLVVVCSGTDTSCLEQPPAPEGPDCTRYPECLNYAECNSLNGCLAPSTPGIRIVPIAGLITSENGRNDSFQVVLNDEPTADVSIAFTSDDTNEGRPSPASITFTPKNWDIPQTVSVIGEDDSVQDGDREYHIVVSGVYSLDDRYDGMNVAAVTVTNLDDDVGSEPATFSIRSGSSIVSSAEIWESGHSVQFSIAPDIKPIYDVTVTLEPLDDGELTVTGGPFTFTPGNYKIRQNFTIKGLWDGVVDGDKTTAVRFRIESQDPRFNTDGVLEPFPVYVHDCDDSAEAESDEISVRIMAANITSGNNQSYDTGEGSRIFMAAGADIVLIQEFNMKMDTIDHFVENTFGHEFDYYRGTGDIPNGIISRFPIIEKGQWASPQISNRGFNYAVIAMPDASELLAVSVHLSTDTAKQTSEITSLADKIASLAGGRHVVLGGDFNTKLEKTVTSSSLSTIFDMNPGSWPVDQAGNATTNAGRDHHYDWLLGSASMTALETPVVIGEHTYSHGHVIDTRVYASCPDHGNETESFPPIRATDSSSDNMQHMAVIRDFVFSNKH